MVFYVLFDFYIDLVVLIGLVGSGKIFFVFVVVLEMVVECNMYDKIIVM